MKKTTIPQYLSTKYGVGILTSTISELRKLHRKHEGSEIVTITWHGYIDDHEREMPNFDNIEIEKKISYDGNISDWYMRCHVHQLGIVGLIYDCKREILVDEYINPIDESVLEERDYEVSTANKALDEFKGFKDIKKFDFIYFEDGLAIPIKRIRKKDILCYHRDNEYEIANYYYVGLLLPNDKFEPIHPTNFGALFTNLII